MLQKELVQGESWTVPADQPDVRLATVRPDALAITINGQPVPKLSEQQQSINNVSVTAAALLARGAPAATPAPAQTPAARPAPAARPRASAQPASQPAAAPVAEPVPAPAAT